MTENFHFSLSNWPTPIGMTTVFHLFHQNTFGLTAKTDDKSARINNVGDIDTTLPHDGETYPNVDGWRCFPFGGGILHWLSIPRRGHFRMSVVYTARILLSMKWHRMKWYEIAWDVTYKKFSGSRVFNIKRDWKTALPYANDFNLPVIKY